MRAPEIRRRLALAWRALRHGDQAATHEGDVVRVDRGVLVETADLALLGAGLRPFEAHEGWAALATTDEIRTVRNAASLLEQVRAADWETFERGLAPQEVE